MNVAAFKKFPLMGILRGITPESLEPLIETIVAGGLRTIEITMNTGGAPELIEKAVKFSKGRLVLGAGTVLNREGLRMALDHGATFVVTPVLVRDVVSECVKKKIPVFPGALTPLEIYNAWEAGATMVKVFPVKFFGPEYLQEIKAPLQSIELLACAGVTPGNLRAYLDHGASAVAFGSEVFRKAWLKKKDYASIGNAIERFVKAFLRP